MSYIVLHLPPHLALLGPIYPEFVFSFKCSHTHLKQQLS